MITLQKLMEFTRLVHVARAKGEQQVTLDVADLDALIGQALARGILAEGLNEALRVHAEWKDADGAEAPPNGVIDVLEQTRLREGYGLSGSNAIEALEEVHSRVKDYLNGVGHFVEPTVLRQIAEQIKARPEGKVWVSYARGGEWDISVEADRIGTMRTSALSGHVGLLWQHAPGLVAAASQFTNLRNTVISLLNKEP